MHFFGWSWIMNYDLRRHILLWSNKKCGNKSLNLYLLRMAHNLKIGEYVPPSIISSSRLDSIAGLFGQSRLRPWKFHTNLHVRIRNFTRIYTWEFTISHQKNIYATHADQFVREKYVWDEFQTCGNCLTLSKQSA